MSDHFDDLHAAAWTVCVSNLDVSTRFYCEGLGFKEGKTNTNVIEAGSDMAKAFGIPKGKSSGRFLSRGDIVLELVYFEEPKAIGDRKPRPTNTLGPRSLIFSTPNAKAIGARLEQLGGKITHLTEAPPFDSLFVADPDGFVIQLVSLPHSAFQAALEK